MFLAMDCCITPLMVATRAEIAAGRVGDDVCRNWFYVCNNFGGSGYSYVGRSSKLSFSPDWSAIHTVGDNFCRSMFQKIGYSTAAVNYLASIPAGFDIPQSIKTVGTYFLYRMFYDASVIFNDIFRFPVLSATEIAKSNVLTETFRTIGEAIPRAGALSGKSPGYYGLASTVINGNPTPASARYTFRVHKADYQTLIWSDYASLPANWR
jgi:hypothetical protein